MVSASEHTVGDRRRRRKNAEIQHNEKPKSGHQGRVTIIRRSISSRLTAYGKRNVGPGSTGNPSSTRKFGLKLAFGYTKSDQ